MRALRFLTYRVPAALAVSALVLAAVVGPAGTAGAGTTTAASGSSGCQKIFQPPDSWVVVCGNGGGSGGGPGSGGGGGGGGGKFTCTLTPLTPEQIAFEGLPKPPAGEVWAAITCPGNQPFGGVTLESANGTPAVTPEELMEVAEGELKVPVLRPGTAPPLGQDGLVGLPEWYWVRAARWHAINVTVSAGPVWATVTATPTGMTFDPGGGLAGGSCDGPGVPYSAGGASQSACTFTYDQSSATQPGGIYAAAVTVTWLVTWTGSDGNGGTLNDGLQVAFPFALRVAEGQALVTGSGQ